MVRRGRGVDVLAMVGRKRGVVRGGRGGVEVIEGWGGEAEEVDGEDAVDALAAEAVGWGAGGGG